MKLLSTALVLLVAFCSVASAAVVSTPYSVTPVNPLGVDCSGYIIELLNPGAEFDYTNATSSVFTLDLGSSSETILVFNGGNVLPIGASVNFNFDVLSESANNTTSHWLSYTAIPVPEPALMSMLGLGALGVLRKRTR